MKAIISSAADVFNNPENPWYYVVGVLFLLLVFAALAIYMTVSNKRRKAKEAKNAEQPQEATEESAGETLEPVKEEQSDGLNSGKKAETAEESAGETVEPIKEEQNDELDSGKKTETTEESAGETVEPIKEEQSDELDSGKKTETTEESATNEQAKEEQTQSAPQKKKRPKKEPEVVITQATKTRKPTDTAKESVKKTASKPKSSAKQAFIDRLIDTAEVHSVYNEIKNAILSYQGIKSKLSKDNESFIFGTEKKAEIDVKNEAILLKLNVDPVTTPKRYGVKPSGDRDLPAIATVREIGIDNAKKLITYAMNIAMLTKNERHRDVDYVKKAVAAKQKAQNK